MLKFAALFTLTLYTGLRGIGSNSFQHSSYKEKSAGSADLSVSYDHGFIIFLMLCMNIKSYDIKFWLIFFDNMKDKRKMEKSN